MTISDKPVAIIGNSGRALDQLFENTETLFQFAGRNTGNLAFWYAIDQQISEAKLFFGWDADPAFINDSCKALIVVAANWLYERFDLGPIAILLERVNIPAIVVGLGAQLPHRDHPLVLKSGTERFVHVLSEKKIPVCVRGHMTQEILASRKVDNTLVTGCPSNFINPTSSYQHDYATELLNKVSRVAINPEVNGSHALINKALRGLCNEKDWVCFIQDPLTTADAIFSGLVTDSVLKEVSDSGLLSETEDVWRSKFRRNFRVYFDAVTWMYELKMMDLALGSKFHGNMLAFQVGVPTIFIMHDTRTEELANALLLPRIQKHDLLNVSTIEELLPHITFDAAAYFARRKEIGVAFAGLLRSLDIKISSALARYTEQSGVAQLGLQR